MAAPNEKIATSLEILRALQVRGRRVFSAKELSRVHRERLVKHGYLQRVIDGWLVSASPEAHPGESTPWLTAFWEFCSVYCEVRFGADWHLSAEQSLPLHVGTTAIPTQVLVFSPKGQNNKLALLHDTSIYDLKEAQSPPAEDLTVLNGLRVLTLEAALVRLPEAFFAAKPLETQIALNSVPDGSGILRILLRGGHSVVAGRLAGAFRRTGRGNLADEIVSVMRAADHNVTERDPFVEVSWVGRRVAAGEAPIVGRLHGLWALTREAVIAAFPRAPGLPRDRGAYLQHVDEIYVTDAYHSLSIEGYQVTTELIERVRTGAWRPETSEEDLKSRNAMAARGYWQAFTVVKRGVAAVLDGTPAAQLAREAHPEWYRELFQPSVAAGLIAPAALAGYRNDFVYLKTSRYVPPRWETVRDAMPTLFELMAAEPEASVRAVLGHWLIGYIHPYMDGNGRIARFLMNVMLASGGYPWTVIRLADRTRYLRGLDSASLEQDIRPFAELIAERIRSDPSANA
jgi:Fic/DOC family